MEPLDVRTLHYPPHLGPKEGHTLETSMTLCTPGLSPLLAVHSLAVNLDYACLVANDAPRRVFVFGGRRAAGGCHHE